jgi:type I restriction enzyme S subunit
VRGATTGRKNIADKSYCIGRGLAAIRGKSSIAITDFLWFSLDAVAAKILSESSGSTFPNIPGEKLERIEISLPSLNDQQRMAAQLSVQMTSAERLRRTLTEQLDAINALPAALLQRAFREEL